MITGGASTVMRSITRWIEYLPRGIRYAWCELSGAHQWVPAEAWQHNDGKTLGYRVSCSRCPRATRWFNVGEGRGKDVPSCASDHTAINKE